MDFLSELCFEPPPMRISIDVSECSRVAPLWPWLRRLSTLYVPRKG